MKKLLLSVLSYLLCVTMSFAQEDSISTKFKGYLKKTIASSFDYYSPIQTLYGDSIKMKDLFNLDTSTLNKIEIFRKIFDSRKFIAVSNQLTAKVQKKINKNIIDNKIIKFYDTTDINYTKINLVDSSIKYNKEIANDESYSFRIMHSFTFKNRDNITITDTAMFIYTPKSIRMVSTANSYKKGFNYMGTLKFNRDIFNEEKEILLEKRRKNKG
jgi:hypothetical protein